jgi:folate-dependent tRNA-U54 methylase TrmFO/GidA
MKANFGILPPLNTSKRLNKRKRAAAYAERALGDLEAFLAGLDEAI